MKDVDDVNKSVNLQTSMKKKGDKMVLIVCLKIMMSMNT